MNDRISDMDADEREWFAATQPYYDLETKIKRVSQTLMALDSPIEDRRELRTLDKELDDLCPFRMMRSHGWKARLEESGDAAKRAERLANMEERLHTICTRYQIDPEAPLSPEIKRRIAEVLKEAQAALRPLEERRNQLKKAAEEAVRSFMEHKDLPTPERLKYMDEHSAFLDESHHILEEMQTIRYLWPHKQE